MIGCLTPGTGLPTCLPVLVPNASPFLPCSSEERHQIWNSAVPAPTGFMETGRACIGWGGLRLLGPISSNAPVKRSSDCRRRVKEGCVEDSGSGYLLAAFAERQDAASSESPHCITLGVPQCEWHPLELCSAQTVHRGLCQHHRHPPPSSVSRGSAFHPKG